MQRDSDSEGNYGSEALEKDQMLKTKNPKKKKSSSIKPIIVGASSEGGRMNVVIAPSESGKHKKVNQDSDGKPNSDQSTMSTTAAAQTQSEKDETLANARKRKQTPAAFQRSIGGQDSPKTPAWSRVFHISPTNGNNQGTSNDNNGPSPTMERYLNEQFRQWAAQSEAGDTVHFPYLPPSQKTWSHPPVNPLAPPLSTFALYDGKIKHAKSEETRPWSRGISEDDDELSPLSPLRRMGYGGKQTDAEKNEKKRRVVEKDGGTNVQYKNISERRRRYISDFYTTLVDSGWPETLLLFALSFFITWLFFGAIYYIICLTHGDFEPDHLPSNQSISGWKPCIWEIEDFSSCYLFSLETQHTIGYGSRQTTNLCVSAMITVSFQSIVGCLIQAFMVGLVFAKLSRPRQRSRTVVFSKQAVICERNRKLCLLLRVGDMRDDSFIVNAQVSVKVIRRKVTEEGEMFHDVGPLKITPDCSSEPCVFLIWPITLVHEIDEDSPFYKHSAADLMRDKFELHVVLEGTIESTSMNFQARTSYLPHEIYWGHRFEPMMLYRRDHNKYQVNFSAFHSTYEVDTPLCSSFDLEQYYKARDQQLLRKHDSAPNTLKSLNKKSTISNQLPPPLPRSLPPPTQPISPPFFIVESEETSSSHSTSTGGSNKSEAGDTNDDNDRTDTLHTV